MERRHACAAVGLVPVTLLLGCGSTKSPTEPTPPPAVAPALQDFRLSGGVGDTARRPLSGAKVEVLDGARVAAVATTDDAGRFSMPGTFTGYITLAASKDGYVRQMRPLVPPGRPLPDMNPGGKWEVYFSLAPVGAPANIAGVYSLTLSAASSCTNLPAAARARSYTATIVPGAGSTTFLVGLSDARFLSLVPCIGPPQASCTYNQLSIGIAGDFVSMGTTGIVEHLQDTTYLVIAGGAAESFGASGMSAPFDGSFQYCASEPVWTSGEYWECQGSIQCDSRHHQLTLVRR